jgi:hypothetical protein
MVINFKKLIQISIVLIACLFIVFEPRKKGETDNTGKACSVGFWYKLIKCILVIVVISVTFQQFWPVEGFKAQDDYPVKLEDRCRGGMYMHQGEGESSRKCRDLIKSGSVNECQKGFNNLPLAPFDYTSQSDDNFENKQCSK